MPASTPARGGLAMEDVCQAIRHGSLMGARGNSGVILSQILRGLADTFSPLDAVSGADVAAGLRRAADAAYEAVLRPVEGTILTVVRSAAESVERAVSEGETTLVGVLERAADAAREAVASTPDLLPVLREAGVVDAGGRGFELLLAVVPPRRRAAARCRRSKRCTATVAVGATAVTASGASDGGDVADLRYEVMFFLDAPDDSIDGFKSAWGDLGDSIVVVGGDGLWNCHVHTDDIGAAIEAGIAVGRPHDIRVTDLLEQVADRDEEPALGCERAAPAAPASCRSPPRWSRSPWVTACATSCAGLGVQQVVAGGQSMNPSTAQILEAVDACVGRGRDRAARTTRTSCPWRSRCPTSPTCRSRWCPPRPWSRRSARSWPTTPMRRSTPTRPAMAEAAGPRARGRGHAGGARQRGRVRADRQRRLDRDHA